jgi:hypothetical protein
MAKQRAAKKKSKPRRSKARRAAAAAAPRNGGRFAPRKSSGRKHGGHRAADSRALPKMMSPEDRRDYNLIYKAKIADGYTASDAKKVALKAWTDGRLYDMAIKEGEHREKLAAEKEGRELSHLEHLWSKLRRKR